jgi:hypothetical protein
MKSSRAILQQAPDPHSTLSQNLSRTPTSEASLPPQETNANTEPPLFPENEDPAAITSLTKREFDVKNR